MSNPPPPPPPTLTAKEVIDLHFDRSSSFHDPEERGRIVRRYVVENRGRKHPDVSNDGVRGGQSRSDVWHVYRSSTEEAVMTNVHTFLGLGRRSTKMANGIMTGLPSNRHKLKHEHQQNDQGTHRKWGIVAIGREYELVSSPSNQDGEQSGRSKAL